MKKWRRILGLDKDEKMQTEELTFVNWDCGSLLRINNMIGWLSREQLKGLESILSTNAY